MTFQTTRKAMSMGYSYFYGSILIRAKHHNGCYILISVWTQIGGTLQLFLEVLEVERTKLKIFRFFLMPTNVSTIHRTLEVSLLM